MMPLRGGLAPLTLASKAPVLSWWLSGGVSASNALAAYAPKGAASLAASYTNLANAGTYDCTTAAAPTLDASGWVFSGAQHLITGITPTFDGTIILKVSNMANNASLLGCERTTGGRFVYIYRSSTSGFQYANCDLGTAYITPSATSGVFAVAGRSAYRNGILDATINTTSSMVVNRTCLIGARYNSSGTITENANCKIQAVAFYNSTLTQAQVSAIGAAMP